MRFQSYTLAATYDVRISAGKLVHDNSIPINLLSKNILTLKNSTNNIAVTPFLTNFRSQLYGIIARASVIFLFSIHLSLDESYIYTYEGANLQRSHPRYLE